MRGRDGSVPLALAATAVAALASLPLAYLLIRSLGAGADAWAILSRDAVRPLIMRTVLMVASVAAAATALGLALAWLTVRTDMPWRRTFSLLCALPLVIPSYVTALALIAAIGPGGLSSEISGGDGGAWLFGFPGSTISLTLATYPYVFLLTSAALRRQDPALEEAARSLGRTRWTAFRTVTLPGIRPALVGGAVLSALYALSDFGVVSLMRHDVLTRAIFQQYRSLFDREPAAVLGLVLVALTAVILVLESRTRTGGRVARGGGASRPAEPLALGRWRWPAAGLCAAVVAVALAIPIGVLIWWALRGTAAELPDAGEIVGWVANSLLVAVLAAGVAVVAALPVAALAASRKGRLAQLPERVTYASNALPGIVIALALVFFATRVATPLYQTLALLIVAYVIRFLPQSLAAAHGALVRVDPQLAHAARGLGAGPWRTLARVTAPLVAPGLLAGATLVFLSTMKELPATLLLRPTGFDTLATEVWTATSVSSYSAAAVPALLLILVSIPVVWLLQVRLPAQSLSDEQPAALGATAPD